MNAKLKTQVKDLYVDLTGGHIPGVRHMAELEV